MKDNNEIEREYFEEASKKKIFHQMTLRSNVEFNGFGFTFNDIEQDSPDEVVIEEKPRESVSVKIGSLDKKTKSLF